MPSLSRCLPRHASKVLPRHFAASARARSTASRAQGCGRTAGVAHPFQALVVTGTASRRDESLPASCHCKPPKSPTQLQCASSCLCHASVMLDGRDSDGATRIKSSPLVCDLPKLKARRHMPNIGRRRRPPHPAAANSPAGQLVARRQASAVTEDAESGTSTC